jgi:TATA-box binding protein (TBP) (component of TFIID and TFIIIB)
MPPKAAPAAPAPNAPLVPARQYVTPPDRRLHIQNVVSTFVCGIGGGAPVTEENNGAQRIDLVQLMVRLATYGAGGGDYDEARFSTGKLRTLSPHSTGLVFESGKVVVTGAKDELLSLLAAHKYVGILRRAGYRVYLRNFCVQNIVGSVNYASRINLPLLAAQNGLYAAYQPSLFPGCIVRLPNMPVFLIYDSGMVVVTGARTREDSNRGHENCTELVSRYLTDSVDPHASMRAADARAAQELSRSRALATSPHPSGVAEGGPAYAQAVAGGAPRQGPRTLNDILGIDEAAVAAAPNAVSLARGRVSSAPPQGRKRERSSADDDGDGSDSGDDDDDNYDDDEAAAAPPRPAPVPAKAQPKAAGHRVHARLAAVARPATRSAAARR